MELSSPEAAEILGVHELTIRNYVDRGLLKARRMGIRRIVRIEPDDLRSFAKKHDFVFDEEIFRRIAVAK